MKIAVIGAGIAGLGCAWLLSKNHDVTIFEANGYLGGHANTVDVTEPDGRVVAVDTGFIVYNVASYPNLIALFDLLGVKTAPTEMSFAVSLRDGRYEYSGNGLSGLFGQRSNVFSPNHWRMVGDILRFFRAAPHTDWSAHDPNQSLGDWLEENGYSKTFIERHIIPMGAAIWSTPSARMMDFPIAAFMRFFTNHGLLEVDLEKRPQWRTVCDGSRAYVNKVLEDFSGRVQCGAAVVSISRTPAGVEVRRGDGTAETFDEAVIATHGDEALGLITDAGDEERNLLSQFTYTSNTAVLHTDASLMPRRRNVWTSWNYLSDEQLNAPAEVSLTYWMNCLQPLHTNTDYFVTLNPGRPIEPSRILRTVNYAHPQFDAAAMRAQKDLWELQGRNRLWFAGSYFGYGFHEDALQAGLAVAEDLGGCPRPWTVADPRGRVLANGAHRQSGTRANSLAEADEEGAGLTPHQAPDAAE